MITRQVRRKRMNGNGSPLRAQDATALLDALDRLYQPVLPADFPAHLFGVLSELFPGTLASFDFQDSLTGQVESHISPHFVQAMPPAELEAVVREYLWQNPVLRYLTEKGPGNVVQPTDLMSQREFRRTDLYAQGFVPAGVEYQIAAGLSWPGRVGGFTINRPRTRNFTAYEVTLIRHLRPHVERAFAAAWRLDARAGATPATLETLTHREWEVWRWLGAGKRNAQIASLLSISPRTVHKHVEHVFAKLGVESRAAAASAWAGR